MSTDAEKLKNARRQLGGMSAALNRARQHEHEMFILIAEMYAVLPEDLKDNFKDRFDREFNRARK